jgi:hypothetical protein
VELLGFVALPAFLYAVGVRDKNITLIRWTAAWTVLGIVVNRFNICLVAFNWHLPSSERYFPALDGDRHQRIYRHPGHCDLSASSSRACPFFTNIRTTNPINRWRWRGKEVITPMETFKRFRSSCSIPRISPMIVLMIAMPAFWASQVILAVSVRLKMDRMTIKRSSPCMNL